MDDISGKANKQTKGFHQGTRHLKQVTTQEFLYADNLVMAVRNIDKLKNQ